MDRRISFHPVFGELEVGKSVNFRFDNQIYSARDGETIAAALLANGIRTLRVHEEKGTPRGIYCNIGHCFECRVTVNKKPSIRACMTLVEEGMEVISGGVLPTPLKQGGHHS